MKEMKLSATTSFFRNVALRAFPKRKTHFVRFDLYLKRVNHRRVLLNRGQLHGSLSGGDCFGKSPRLSVRRGQRSYHGTLGLERTKKFVS
jgi:hypothetical protein